MTRLSAVSSKAYTGVTLSPFISSVEVVCEPILKIRCLTGRPASLNQYDEEDGLCRYSLSPKNWTDMGAKQGGPFQCRAVR